MKMKFKNFPKRSIAVALALVLLVGIAFMVPSQAAADTSSLGKLVDYFQANNNTFALSASSRFFLDSEPTGELLQTVQLAQRQFAADGIPTSTPMDIVWGDTTMLHSGDIYVRLVSGDKEIGPEGYKIVITSHATVSAEDVDGLLYGLNQLQKHFRAAGDTSIVGFVTYDNPDTKERTAQLDCARKYLTVEYVCNFIKQMSWMGYNTLQLHVSEDGGFRADFWDPEYYVDGHYTPENDLSWICGSHVQSWVKDETANGGKNYRNDPDANKYLTTAELIQIINTCKEYHIDIVPSFDSPAHMDYLNWKFEQNYKSNTSYSFTYGGTTYKASDTSGCINYSGTTGGTTPTWPNYTCMDIRDNTTRGKMSQAFVKTIYSNMADFFKYYAGSEYFVIGADEPNLYNSAIKSTAWRYSLLPGYINEINAILEGKGYTCRVFNDFLNASALATLDDDIQILYWNTPYNSINGTAGAYTVDYINDSGTYTEDPMNTVANYVSDGRTVFNCVNQHTYYVLRVSVGNTSDARSVSNRNWEFYGADEQTIWNDWTPNNIRKKGVKTEPDAIVPDAQLGGAYFLTWHDYAAVNTETEMWNGVDDFVANTGEHYSVRYRMWSNIMKMWNWDINSSLSYANFAIIRNTLGDFPGVQRDTYSDASYAKSTSLPDSTAPYMVANHDQLTAAVTTKLAAGRYTSQSYAAYLSAYNYAVQLSNEFSATEKEMGAALQSLNEATNALEIVSNEITVERKATINGVVHTIDKTLYYVPSSQSAYNIHIPSLSGYDFTRVEGSTFELTETGDGSGYLTGSIDKDINITMWYTSNITTSRLDSLIEEAITEQGDFTEDSWNNYATALSNAKKFSLAVTTLQSEVDGLVKALEDARSALVVPSNTTTIAVEKLSDSFEKGNQIGLTIRTSSNIPSLVITDANGKRISPDYISGEVQELNNGDVVKIWLVMLPAEEAAGTFTYTVSYNQASDSVSVTVN